MSKQLSLGLTFTAKIRREEVALAIIQLSTHIKVLDADKAHLMRSVNEFFERDQAADAIWVVVRHCVQDDGSEIMAASAKNGPNSLDSYPLGEYKYAA